MAFGHVKYHEARGTTPAEHNADYGAYQARYAVAGGLLIIGLGIVMREGWNCLTIPLLVFVGFMLLSITDEKVKYHRSKVIGAGFLGAAATCLLLAILVLSQKSKPISEQLLKGLVTDTFNAGWCILGATVLGGLGIFCLFPPAMAMLWDGTAGGAGIVREDITVMDNIINSNNMINSNANSTGDPTDQMILNLVNSDSSLKALLQTDPGLIDKIQTTFNYYNPESGVFGAWSQRVRGEGRVKLLQVLNREQLELINHAQALESRVLESQQNRAEFQLFLAKNYYALLELKGAAEKNGELFKFEKKAYDEGMLPEDFSVVKKEEKLLDLRLREDREQSNQILVNAQKYTLAEQNVTDDLKERLAKAVIKRNELAAQDLPEDVKKELLEIEDDHITDLKNQLKRRYERTR